MSYVGWLSISFVLLATASFVYWAVTRIASLIQATLKEMNRTATDRPKTLSALGDAIDALQIAMREIDTKHERTLSLARSNRARITNLQHRGEGTDEAGADEAPAASNQPRLVRLPGRHE